MKRLLLALGLVGLLAGTAKAASTSPSISIVGPSVLAPGDGFSVTWEAPKRVHYPYGFAECPGTGWSEYRFLQVDGTIGIFELASADPSFVFAPGNHGCSVALLDAKGAEIASAAFTVVA